MDQSPTVNNSPAAAKESKALGGVAAQTGLPGVNQNVNPWPKAASLTKSELDAILSRLVERVQYITGATGAAIGLLEGTDMVCRATSGTTAPDLGVHLETWKGLSGECIRSGQTLRCDNVDFDKRVEVESCRRMGVQSIIVTPVRRNNVVVGIFELFSSQPYAIQDRDVATLQRTSEVVKKELERRPLVVDAAYLRLPDQASHETIVADDHANGKKNPTQSAPSENEVVRSVADVALPATVTEIQNSPEVLSVPCRNCGAALETGRLLCPECGSLQADPEMLPVTEPEEAPAAVTKASEDRDPFSFKQRIRIPRYTVGVILGTLALFVAFVPIHTNQVDAQSPAAAQAQEQASAPAVATAAPVAQQPASPTAAVAPAPQNNVSAPPPVNSSSTSAPVGSGPSGQQAASAPPVTRPSQLPQAAQTQIVPMLGNQASAQAPATAEANMQALAGAPVQAVGPVTATPHAGPVVQPENPGMQPRYEAPQRTTQNHQNEPWFIARVNNAIDSFQQMFQPPPDPGPTPEQLGDGRVVVWVDLTTGLYYCPSASTYGKTEKGKFLTQKEAQAEYFTSAIRIGCK